MSDFLTGLLQRAILPQAAEQPLVRPRPVSRFEAAAPDAGRADQDVREETAYTHAPSPHAGQPFAGPTLSRSSLDPYADEERPAAPTPTPTRRSSGEATEGAPKRRDTRQSADLRFRPPAPEPLRPREDRPPTPQEQPGERDQDALKVERVERRETLHTVTLQTVIERLVPAQAQDAAASRPPGEAEGKRPPAPPSLVQPRIESAPATSLPVVSRRNALSAPGLAVPPQPVVHVSIGRIEVRATSPRQTSRPAAPAPREKAESLEEYLKKRSAAR